MRRVILVWVTVTLLVMSGSAAWATLGSIAINDLTDTISVNYDPGDTGFLIINTPVISGETVTITGTWNANAAASNITLNTQTTYALFRAPAGIIENDAPDTAKWPNATTGPVDHISDFITVSFNAPDANGLQSFTIFFESDGSTSFQSDLLANIPSTVTPQQIIENGSFQDLSTLVPRAGTNRVINLQAASDIVPIPPTALLLGTGLLGDRKSVV